MDTSEKLPNFSFLGPLLLSNSGKVNTEETLKSDQVVGLYFSAFWSVACKQFTPTLSELYKKWNIKSKKIEIIFVSRDRNEDEFNEYYKEMPWLAIPFQNNNKISSLKLDYRVKGVPSLVIVDKKGQFLCGDAIEEIDILWEKALENFQELRKKRYV